MTDPVAGEGLLARFEISSADNFTAIINELCIRWYTTVRSFVKPIDERAGFLKLELDKERGRNTNTLRFQAEIVVTAARDLLGPVIQTTWIGLAVQKIQIVLAYKRLRIIDRVRRQRSECDS